MIALMPRPFIFVHIPKCAGTSIERALIPFVVNPGKNHRNLKQDERKCLWLPGKTGLQHSKLAKYEKCYNIQEYFRCSMVRNPWSRAVSQIDFLRRLHFGQRLFGSKGIKECLRIYCKSTARIHGHDLGACQLDYLLTSAGEMGMDFVGRFETLTADFEKMCARIGIAPVPELPHAFNLKRELHYSAYYDEESADWIRKRFGGDIDYFHYEFENESNFRYKSSRRKTGQEKK